MNVMMINMMMRNVTIHTIMKHLDCDENGYNDRDDDYGDVDCA